MVRCLTCKYSKWQRYLTSLQQLKKCMADMLLETHEPSRAEKRRMELEIVTEFCKLGKEDISEDCATYSYSRLRRLLRGKK